MMKIRFCRPRWPITWAILLPLLTVLSLSAMAVSPFDFDRFSDQLGGRQSTVYEIFEDNQGFLWFAGDTDGLLRYDGYELMSWSEGFVASETRHNISTLNMTRNGSLWVGSWGNGLQFWDPNQRRFGQFLHNPGDPDGLADNRVQSLLEDRDGLLWIGTVAGINFVDPNQPDQIRRFALDQPDHPLYGERIWRMIEVGGSIWLATSSGVYRITHRGHGWRHYQLSAGPEVPDHERSEEARTVAWAHGRVWAASQLGAFYWDESADEFRPVEFAHDASRTMPRINEMLASQTHGVLAGAHDGLYRIDPETRAFAAFGDENVLIPDVDVRALYEDVEGNLWIGTRDQGLIHGRRQQQTLAPMSRRMPAELVEHGGRLSSALLNDRDGRLWVSYPGGVFRKGPGGDWRNWYFAARDGVRRVERIAEDDRGRIWLATDAGLFMIDEAEQLSPQTAVFDLLGLGVLPVNELWIEPGGCMWLALWHHGLVCWEPGSQQVELFLTELQQTRGDSIYHLASDGSGRLWAATRYAGLYSIDLVQRETIRWSLGNPYWQEPSYYCAVSDADTLWLCTGDGLVAFDLINGTRRRFGTEHGLPAERVSGFFQHPDAGRWVLTPNGLARWLPERQRFVSHGLADGLPGLGLQRNAVTLDHAGRLVVGTNRGAALLQDASLSNDYQSPRLVLSRAWIGREDITRRLNPARLEIRLAAHERDLLLQFAVLDFHDPTGNVMRMKLEGLDEDFGPLTKERSVRYVNLAPGRYQLQVEGWNSRGVEAEESLVLNIVVEAPWWQSIWFGLLAFALLLALAWMLVHLRFRSMRVANVRLQGMVDERTRALADANDQLRTQSSQDFLTGLLNRRGFNDRFEPLRRICASRAQPLSLVLFDLDHFKALNDRFGHDAGDRVLRQVADILKEFLPDSALASRWGGEEFLIALDGYSSDQAVAWCEKMRQAFAASPLRVDGQRVTFGATFGVVSAVDPDTGLDGWMRQVDRALYQGKRGGRDTIRVYRQED